MNIKEIKEMIELMNENELSELELEKDGLKIRLKKKAGGGIEQVQPAASAQLAAAAPQQPAPPPQQQPAQQSAADRQVEIKAPMVGTFYKAPSPDSPPFVKPGDGIEPGQVICIIEAMKLMNEIKSEVRGRIISVLVENADPVEFGQPLFIIEPR